MYYFIFDFEGIIDKIYANNLEDARYQLTKKYGYDIQSKYFKLISTNFN